MFTFVRHVAIAAIAIAVSEYYFESDLSLLRRVPIPSFIVPEAPSPPPAVPTGPAYFSITPDETLLKLLVNSDYVATDSTGNAVKVVPQPDDETLDVLFTETETFEAPELWSEGVHFKVSPELQRIEYRNGDENIVITIQDPSGAPEDEFFGEVIEIIAEEIEDEVDDDLPPFPPFPPGPPFPPVPPTTSSSSTQRSSTKAPSSSSESKAQTSTSRAETSSSAAVSSSRAQTPSGASSAVSTGTTTIATSTSSSRAQTTTAIAPPAPGTQPKGIQVTLPQQVVDAFNQIAQNLGNGGSNNDGNNNGGGGGNNNNGGTNNNNGGNTNNGGTNNNNGGNTNNAGTKTASKNNAQPTESSASATKPVFAIYAIIVALLMQ